jgi:PAS domain S-box-containing protein
VQVAGKAKRGSRRSLARPRRGRAASAGRRSARLHESLDQFRLAQDALGVVTWIWDIEADRVQWYGDASRLLGLAPHSFSGRFVDYLGHLHPEDAPRARQNFIECLKGRRPQYRMVERVLWPDGGVHWLETYGRASYGPDGRATRVAGVIKEITELKREESARVKAEKQLARVFDASPEYIVLVRAGDGMFLAANPAFERVTGYRAGEIVGRTVNDINLWAIPGERVRFLADLRKDGMLRDRPALIRARDGKMLAGMLSASLFEHEGEELIISIMRDVSEAKRLERRARQSERKYAALFETSPVGLVVTRPAERRIVEINDAALRMLGLQREQVIGALTGDVLHVHNREEVNQLRALALAGERVIGKPLRFRRNDGKEMECVISTGAIELDGEPHFVISVLDVTDEKKLERRASQSERKYEALFETSPEAIAISRRQDGITLAVNAAWETLIGHRRERVIFRPSGDLGLWRDRAERDAVIARVDSDGIVRNHATRLVRADGAEIEVLLSATSLELEGERCVVWSWRDVTEARQLERRAHESERKFAALFENSPEPISLMRLSDEVRLAANSAWERVTGHSRDRASSRPATAMSMFRDPVQRRALIDRIAAEGSASNVELRLMRADGTEFDALISGVCIDVEGERCILWNWRDVTAQRRTERERREADARYRALFETALDGIVILSPQWSFVDVNPAACRYMGYAREELVGKPVSAIFGAAELAANPIRPERQWTPVERILTRKDGSTRAVEVQAGPMPDGNILVVARDISERKRNEALLMNIARGVSAEVGDAFFQSLVSHLARELEADFAFIGELVGGDRMHTLAFLADGAIAPNPDYPIASSMSAQALAEGRTVVFAQDVMQRFPDNAEMKKNSVQAYVGTPLYGADGAPLGVLAMAHRKPIERGGFWASLIEIFGARAAAEIERARAEALVRRTNESLERVVRERTAQLEDANRDLESYNYSISHDLRQPLSAIAGFAELLREQANAAGLEAEWVGEIEGNTARMEQMLEALLRLAGAGRGAINRAEVDMRALAESVLRDLSAAAPLAAEVSLGDLPAAMGDAVLLRQVWINLISNALKYSSNSSSPRIEIDGLRRGDATEFTVRDNGVGFDMQHAGRIFDPFQRMPSAKSFEGSGVGLAIVERVVRRHGGSISAQSIPGQGALFRFTLPG